VNVWAQRLNRFVAEHARLVVALVILSTVIPISWLRPFSMSTGVAAMMPENHRDRLFSAWAEDHFNIVDPALILITRDGSHGVFTPKILALVSHLSEAIMAMDSIDESDLVSLSETDNITADEDTLIVEPFFDRPPQTQAEADAVRAAVFANPMMIGSLASRDGSATVIVAEVLHDHDRHAAYDRLKEIVRNAPDTDANIYISGRPVIEGELARMAGVDIRRMLPIVLITTVTLLWLILGCARGAVLPGMIVMLSILWVAGIALRLGIVIVPMMSVIPTLLVAVGVADGVHVIHNFLLKVAVAPHVSTRDVVTETMDELWAPLTLTSLTTAAGFLSLAISPIVGVKWLGALTALGVVFALGFSLTLLPAAMVVLPRPQRAAERLELAESEAGRPLERGIRAIATLVTERPWSALIGSLILSAICLARLGELNVDASILQNFPHDHQVRRADSEFIAHFHGSQPIEIVLTAKEKDAWKDPAALRHIESLQAFIEGRGESGKTRSIADYIKRMHEVMNGNDAAHHVIPNDSALIAQYLLLYSISGDSSDLDDVVDYDYQIANVRGNLRSDHSPLVSREIRAISKFGKSLFDPLGIDARVTGSARLMLSFVTMIVDGQIASLAIALAVIAMITALVFRSILGGLLTCIPVAFATVLNFGWLPWIGAPLGIVTAMMSSVGIGIGVDYAIHFIMRYSRNRRNGLASERAMLDTLRTSGVAIFYNALVVMLAFSALSLSQFPPNRAFGQLVTLNMAICLLSTTTLLAALLHALQPRFLTR
jgi:hypothetical protein